MPSYSINITTGNGTVLGASMVQADRMADAFRVADAMVDQASRVEILGNRITDVRIEEVAD